MHETEILRGAGPGLGGFLFAHAFNRSLATKGARLAAEEERAAGVGEIAVTEARAEPKCGWF